VNSLLDVKACPRIHAKGESSVRRAERTGVSFGGEQYTVVHAHVQEPSEGLDESVELSTVKIYTYLLAFVILDSHASSKDTYRCGME
jgi:hypothetical protein